MWLNTHVEPISPDVVDLSKRVIKVRVIADREFFTPKNELITHSPDVCMDRFY